MKNKKDNKWVSGKGALYIATIFDLIQNMYLSVGLSSTDFSDIFLLQLTQNSFEK